MCVQTTVWAMGVAQELPHIIADHRALAKLVTQSSAVDSCDQVIK